MYLFGLGTPGLQKNAWPTKTPRDPSDKGHARWLRLSARYSSPNRTVLPRRGLKPVGPLCTGRKVLLFQLHPSKGSRSVFWPRCFLDAWGTKAKKPHLFRKILLVWPCSLRRQGKKTMIFYKKCGFLAWVPQASKKTLGQKNTSGSL